MGQGSYRRPPRTLVEAFSVFSAATIHEAQGRRGAMHSAIKPIQPGSKVCGPAFTVRCPVGDNLTLLLALDLSMEGDVLVVDVGGISESGGWGEITTTLAKVRKLEGIVIDGGVRDVRAIRELAFAVFARTICLKGTIKQTLGDLNQPINCGGVVVNAGDLIVGDDDGVVVVQQIELESVLENAKHRLTNEEKALAAVRDGVSLIDLLGLRAILQKEK